MTCHVRPRPTATNWSVPQPIATELDEPGRPGARRGRRRRRLRRVPACPSPAACRARRSTSPGSALRSPTASKGLGNLDGDGLGGLGGDPNGSTSCTDVHFGDIDAIAEAGCFLRDPSNPTSGAAISQGEIRLNGLEIIPDAGVKIVIDPRLHTINTTGDVRVVLRAPVIGDITLYHGELHVDLAGSLADAGQTLFDFDTSQFAVSLEGLPDRRLDRRQADARRRHDPDLAEAAGVHGRRHRPGDADRRQRDRPARHARCTSASPISTSARSRSRTWPIDYTASGQRLEGRGDGRDPGRIGLFRDRGAGRVRQRRPDDGQLPRRHCRSPGSRSSPTSTSTASVAGSTCTRRASGSSGRSTSARSRSTRPTTRSTSPARSR